MGAVRNLEARAHALDQIRVVLKITGLHRLVQGLDIPMHIGRLIHHLICGPIVATVRAELAGKVAFSRTAVKARAHKS